MNKLMTVLVPRKAVICALLLTLSWCGFSQTVRFIFVAPANVITTNFGGTLDSALCPFGYAKVIITSANRAAFLRVAPPTIKYVYNSLQAGTDLRDQVNLVLRNSGGVVRTMFYFLVDDRTGLSGAAGDTTHLFMEYTDNGTKYVWPAANNNEHPAGSGRYTGWVMLGEYQLLNDQSQRIGRIAAVDEVVLHETSHTQLLSGSKWEGFGGNWITYGADHMHYLTELLADQEGALNEGLATYYGYILNDSAYRRDLNAFTNDGNRYFLEARSFLAGQPELVRAPRVQDELYNSSGQVFYPNGDPVVIYSYRWKDIPGWYVMFAEGTSTAFFSIFRNQTYRNKDTAASMIRFTTNAMSAERRKRFLTYACNRLAIRMETYNNSTRGRADTSRISSMYPFALLDLLTHFGMSDSTYQRDYRINYPDRHPRAYTEYWNHRAAVRTLVQADIDASPIRFNEALQKIRDYFKRPNTILAPNP